MNSALFGQCVNVEGSSVLLHGTSVAFKATKSSPASQENSAKESKLQKMRYIPMIYGMKPPRESRPWPQEKRKRFAELLDAKLAEGVSYSEIAKALGLRSTRSLEHDWRYDKNRRPSRITLERASDYFQVSIFEIDIEYSQPPAGVPASSWDEASEKTKVIASAMFQDLTELPEDQQEILYQLWKQAQAIGKARLEAEGKTKP